MRWCTMSEFAKSHYSNFKNNDHKLPRKRRWKAVFLSLFVFSKYSVFVWARCYANLPYLLKQKNKNSWQTKRCFDVELEALHTTVYNMEEDWKKLIAIFVFMDCSAANYDPAQATKSFIDFLSTTTIHFQLVCFSSSFLKHGKMDFAILFYYISFNGVFEFHYS